MQPGSPSILPAILARTPAIVGESAHPGMRNASDRGWASPSISATTAGYVVGLPRRALAIATRGMGQMVADRFTTAPIPPFTGINPHRLLKLPRIDEEAVQPQ